MRECVEYVIEPFVRAGMVLGREEYVMLPKDPVIRSRLLRSARLLLDWSQARLACEVGVSTSIIYAVESGRLSAESPAAQAVEQALERGGVQFVPAVDPVGPGLRYTSDQIRPAEANPRPQHRRSSPPAVLKEPESPWRPAGG